MFTEEQRKALDLVLADPAMIGAVEQHLQAQNKSATLDQSGVTRKQTTTVSSPLAIFLQHKADTTPPEEPPKTDTPAEGDKPAVEDKQPDMPMMEDAPAAEPVVEAAPASDVATAVAEQIAQPVAEAVTAGIEAVQQTASVFTPEQSQQIVDLVNAAVAPIQAAMQEMANMLATAAPYQEMSKQLKSVQGQLDVLMGVKVANEQPKMTLTDFWKQRATTSDKTVVKADDPLASKALQLPTAPQTGAPNLWETFGFKKE